MDIAITGLIVRATARAHAPGRLPLPWEPPWRPAVGTVTRPLAAQPPRRTGSGWWPATGNFTSVALARSCRWLRLSARDWSASGVRNAPGYGLCPASAGGGWSRQRSPGSRFAGRWPWFAWLTAGPWDSHRPMPATQMSMSGTAPTRSVCRTNWERRTREIACHQLRNALIGAWGEVPDNPFVQPRVERGLAGWVLVNLACQPDDVLVVGDGPPGCAGPAGRAVDSSSTPGRALARLRTTQQAGQS